MNMKEIKEYVVLSDVISRYLEIKEKDGEHYKALCPYHDDTTASLVITDSKDMFKCFSCNAVGDVFDFVKHLEKCDTKKAVEIVQSLAGLNIEHGELPRPKPKKPKKKDDIFEILSENPARKPHPEELLRWKMIDGELKRDDLKPHSIFPYRDINGIIKHYDLRYHIGDPVNGNQKKEVLTLSWVKSKKGNYKSWKFRKPSKKLIEDETNDIGPTIFNNSHAIHQHQEKHITIVEGAKCAKLGNKFFNGLSICASWYGGTNAIDIVDWSLVKDRNVTYFRDHDNAGLKAAIWLAENHPHIKFAKIPTQLMQKGDDIEQIIDQCKNNGRDHNHLFDWMIRTQQTSAQFLKENTEIDANIPDDMEPPPMDDFVDEPFIGEEFKEDSKDDFPFRFLGCERGSYYFLPKGTEEVTAFTTSSLTIKNLLALAPLWFWQNKFPSESKQGARVDDYQAAEKLIRLSESLPKYNPDLTRDYGAWMDAGRVVVHTGDKLWVDGVKCNPSDLNSNYIYQSMTPLKLGLSNKPLETFESSKIISIAKMMPFRNEVDHRLFCGWIALCIICGCLKWRPHMSLNGPAGSGKSWILDEFLYPLVGPSALRVGGDVTAAGIYQTLGNSALAVINDEFEGMDKKGKAIVADKTKLFRAASSGETLLKGTASGKAVKYTLRCMALMSGVSPEQTLQADLDRITPLELTDPRKRKTNAEDFDILKNAIRKTLTKEYCDNLRTRMVHRAKDVREIIAIFSKIIGEKHPQRFADQVGAQLGGAYSLDYDSVPDDELARKHIEGYDLETMKTASIESDHDRCLGVIIESIIRNGNEEFSVYDCIRRSRMRDEFGEESKHAHVYQSMLKNRGIIVEEECIYIQSSSEHIKVFLNKTPWEKSFRTMLKRSKGAKECNKNINGGSKPCIMIPLKTE